MSFWDLPTASEQLKDLHNSNNLLRPHTPLSEMNQIVTNAKIKYKNDNFEKHMKKTCIVQKIVKNMRNLLWCCRAPVASDREEESGQVSQTVAPGHHDLMIFKHYWHKNK